MTPPVDEDEKNEEARQLEAKARKGLEDDGCPPCYPPDLDITLRNIPQKFQSIVGYWLSLLRTDDVVLCAQVSDWRKFRADQLCRRRFRNEHFDEFLNEIRERRRRHGLDGDVHLLPNLRQQCQLENWTEFQNYHLKQLERFEAKQNESKQKLDDARKLVRNTNVSGFRRTADNIEALEHMLKCDERNLERHKILLHWIEQQRQAMDSRHLTPPLQEDDGQAILSKAGSRTSARSSRKRRLKASAVLGQAKVMKAKSKKQNALTQKLRQPEFEPIIHNLDAVPQASMCQETTPQLTEEGETPLRQFRPQRVSKAKHFAKFGAKSLSGTQRRGTESRRSPDRARSKRRPAPQ